MAATPFESPIDAEAMRAWPIWRRLVLAARPRTLPVALGPVLVGTALAARQAEASVAVALTAALGALLLQIASNLANDLFDHEKGADTDARLGPPRAMQLGLLSTRQIRLATAASLALAALAGVYLVSVAGWPIVAIGVVSMAAALAYTGGPWPLGYHGLGDPTVFLFFGIVAVTGTYYVHTLEWSGLALLASLPVGALATAILTVNNLRDIETDRAAGKRTLAVRIGARATRREWALLVGFAYALPPVLWLAGLASPILLLPLLSAPLAWHLWRAVSSEDGPALNGRLAETAQLGFVYSAAFALAWLFA